MCINSTNIPPIMIINRIYETQNLLSLVSFLVGLRTNQHPCIYIYIYIYICIYIYTHTYIYIRMYVNLLVRIMNIQIKLNAVPLLTRYNYSAASMGLSERVLRCLVASPSTGKSV